MVGIAENDGTDPSSPETQMRLVGVYELVVVIVHDVIGKGKDTFFPCLFFFFLLFGNFFSVKKILRQLVREVLMSMLLVILVVKVCDFKELTKSENPTDDQDMEQGLLPIYYENILLRRRAFHSR